VRKTVYKWFWAWDFDKEEEWLNDMAAKGLALVAIGPFKYTFEEALLGEYLIRFILLDNIPRHTESELYIKSVEKTGAEYLGSVARWVYFRRKADKGKFSLISDFNSRIKHLDRLLLLLGILGFSMLLIGGSNILAFYGGGAPFNYTIGIFDTLLGVLLGYGYIRISIKKNKLKKEQKISK